MGIMDITGVHPFFFRSMGIILLLIDGDSGHSGIEVLPKNKSRFVHSIF